jgi:NADPH:quinone reductase-like Zn-dependent oxidoreductase
MRAVIAAGSGGPEVLSVGEVPDVVAGPGEVVLEVVATAGLVSLIFALARTRRGALAAPAVSAPRMTTGCSATARRMM